MVNYLSFLTSAPFFRYEFGKKTYKYFYNLEKSGKTTKNGDFEPGKGTQKETPHLQEQTCRINKMTESNWILVVKFETMIYIKNRTPTKCTKMGIAIFDLNTFNWPSDQLKPYGFCDLTTQFKPNQHPRIIRYPMPSSTPLRRGLQHTEVLRCFHINSAGPHLMAG